MNRGLRKELGFIAGLASAFFWLNRNKSWATLFGTCALTLALTPANPVSLNRRAVVITGGSRGLGLALAKRLIQEGAYVTLLARDSEELARAETVLGSERTDRLFTAACDITHPDSLCLAFKRVQQHFGRIDILINNAGTISVGPFETMERSDFDAQVELHLQTVINATRHILPFFRQAGEGRIVNICSIGGAIPVPHMSTYCASKYALSGLSEVLNAELAPMGVQVTTVYPGLMRTGSPIQAVFKGNHEKEYGWFATGDVLPGLSVSADVAAQIILDGVKAGNSHVSFPVITKVGIVGHAIFPELYACIMKQVARFMPKGRIRVRKTGAASQSWLERQLWYKPLNFIENKAEASLNQNEKYDAEFNLGIHTEGPPTGIFSH